VAQSANQVLSEVLSNPPWVLSATPMCCQFVQRSYSLGRLLIKIQLRRGEFDGEQGLRAGMQIEGFTCPAGPDGSRLRMLEAVHLS
jgi:hypothetical protein